MSLEDQQYFEARMAGADNGMFFTGINAAVVLCDKLDGGQLEASWYNISAECSASMDGGQSWTPQPTGNMDCQYLTDKKSVQITKQIAPISGGQAEAFRDAEDGIIWLEPGQAALVRLTITRPQGVLASGRLLINDYVAAASGWSDNFTYGFMQNTLLVDSQATGDGLRDVEFNFYTADWLGIEGEESENAQYVNNGIFGAQFTGLRVGGTVILQYVIIAPSTVDDPATSAVETMRLFYSNASLINQWQRTVPMYMGADGGDPAWANDVVEANTGGAKTSGDKVYKRSEWLLPTAQFILGIRDSNAGTGSLVISKNVSGVGDQNKEFGFSLGLKNGDGSSLAGEYPYTVAETASGRTLSTGTVKDGDSLRLKHGQTLTISPLPAGTAYTVQETDNAGYFVTVNSQIGGSASGIILADGVERLSYTNYISGASEPGPLPEPTPAVTPYLPAPPQTGSAPAFMALALPLLGMAALAWRKRKI